MSITTSHCTTVTIVPPPPIVTRPNASPVQCTFDDLASRFPHAEGEGRCPVPGDWRNADGEWNDTLYKVVGFVACYSSTEDADEIEMGEPFMAADYVRDSAGAVVIVYDHDNAEAFRRYADEIQGFPLMTLRHPFGTGYIFLYMDPCRPLTSNGHDLFERLAAYLNYRNQGWIANMIAAQGPRAPHRAGGSEAAAAEVEFEYVALT